MSNEEIALRLAEAILGNSSLQSVNIIDFAVKCYQDILDELRF